MATFAMQLHRSAIDRRTIGRLLAALVASVWLYHGLINKLLQAEPRHLLIVQSVPPFGGATGEGVLALIGAGEVVIAIWVLSGLLPRTCAAVQTIALLAMNAIELTFARDYLLWPAMLVPVNLVFLVLVWTAATLRRGTSGGLGVSPERAAARQKLGRDAPTMKTKLRYRLRRHPVPVVAHFDRTLVLTYALPAKVLEPLLPPGLTLDTHNGYGFIAVAMVQTRELRPAFLPRALGRDFFLTGYRVFTSFKTADGRTMRGLRILRSDADRAVMVAAGNLLTHYNYRKCDATVTASQRELSIAISTPDGEADVDLTAHLDRPGELPAGSPFRTLQEARRFAGPLPYTFDYEPQTHSIMAIKGVRENWSPQLVSVEVRRMNFLDRPPFRDAAPILASAFYVYDIPYRWERGVRHTLPCADDTIIRRGPVHGLLQIARFNWPSYAAGILTITAALLALDILPMHRWLELAVLAGAVIAAFWLVVSLVVSHLVYDRSKLMSWTWIESALGFAPGRWTNLHAGLDESTPALRALFPATQGRVFDFFDPDEMTERSILRARRLARNVIAPEKVDFHRLPLADNSIDAAMLLLSAHELRTRHARVVLFKELGRALAPGGRVVLAEHLRDAANFVTFGPGFLHFFTRCEWRRTAEEAGLAVEREFRITPFIAVFVLRRSS